MDEHAGLNSALLNQLGSREVKGSFLLKSTKTGKYSRPTLNAKWHEDREVEPMDYDINNWTDIRERNLHGATYKRVGDITDGSMKDIVSTAHEAMSDVVNLKSYYEDKETHKDMVYKDNFLIATSSMNQREAEIGKPQQGHGSVLPRHPPGHGKMCLDTTQRVDYQYPYEWRSCTPPEDKPLPRFPRGQSEFYDNDGHKRKGINTFRDCYGSI